MSAPPGSVVTEAVVFGRGASSVSDRKHNGRQQLHVKALLSKAGNRGSHDRLQLSGGQQACIHIGDRTTVGHQQRTDTFDSHTVGNYIFVGIIAEFDDQSRPGDGERRAKVFPVGAGIHAIVRDEFLIAPNRASTSRLLTFTCVSDPVWQTPFDRGSLEATIEAMTS